MRQKVFLLTGLLALVLLGGYGVLVFMARNILVADGQTQVRHSLQKQTVSEFLKSFEVVLSSNDLVTPPLDKKLRWGEKVTVVRVRETVETGVEESDFALDWKRRTTKNLRPIEVQNGSVHKATVRIRRVFHDGREVKTEKTILKKQKIPVKRIVFLNKKNHPEKIYDLSKAKKMRLVATAYWLGDPQVPGDVTFSGHKVERGLVAVDPTVLPLGYRLYIPGYGYAYSSDTGSAIKGNRIDLFVESKNASRRWEYVKVDVYILEKAKTW